MALYTTTNDRGFEDSANFNDTFVTTWTWIWIIPISIVFALMIKHRLATKHESSSGSQKSSKKEARIWIIGFIVCLCIFLASISDVTAWTCWVLTFNYSESSCTFLLDSATFFLWAIGAPCLYLFFMYRLYIVYNPKNQSIAVKMYWYVILLILNLLYFSSLITLSIAWRQFDTELYTIASIFACSFEVIMNVILAILFSKPMLKIAISQQKHKQYSDDSQISGRSGRAAPASPTPSTKHSMSRSNGDFPKVGKNTNKYLAILVKMNILSFTALSTTFINRVLDISATVYCPDECWLTYVANATLSIDAFTNIFCIMCTFSSASGYYNTLCSCLDKFVMKHCVGVAIGKRVEKELRKDSTKDSEMIATSVNDSNSPNMMSEQSTASV